MAPRARRVLRARPYRNFTDETLENALNEVQNGSTLRDAAKKFGIPTCTLSRKSRGLFPGKYGGQTVLSKDDERQLTDGIILAGEWGFPLTHYDIKLIVKNYLDRKGIRAKRFKNNMPGRRWMERFLTDHKHILSKRYAENIKRARSEVSEQMIKDYFEELRTSIDGIPETHIINFDETNFSDDPGKKRVIVKRGAKHPERCVDSSKASFSVMMAGAANGVLLAPYIVYKSEHIYDTWTQHGPKGARYNRSKSGWFDTTIFEDWFASLVLPFVKRLKPGPKVLIGDNLSSHLSVYVISECQKHDIRFVLLPPNSTHLCQPLDVSFFHPLKVAWRNVLGDWKEKNRGVIPKHQFPSLLNATLEKIKNTSGTNLIKGFEACGIYPINPSKVLQRLPTWSKSAGCSNTTDDQSLMNTSIVELL